MDKNRQKVDCYTIIIVTSWFTLQRHEENQHTEHAKIFSCPFSVTQKTLISAIENDNHFLRLQLPKQALEKILLRYDDIVARGDDNLFSKNLECRKSFKRRDHLENHLMSVHKVEMKPNTAKSTVKLFRCRFCEKSFPRESHLFQHEKSHSGFWPYWCNSCSRGFSNSNAKSAHKCKSEMIVPNNEVFYF